MKNIIIVVSVLIACAVTYSLGYRSGTRQLPLKKEIEADLTMTFLNYQCAQATNWTKAQSNLGAREHWLTRYYEQTYGIPTGTNEFARLFSEAKAVADENEKHLVSMSSIISNVPHSPDVKITVGNQ